jgi:hypothetical protein
MSVLVKQSESVNFSVEEGRDLLSGGKLCKKIIEKSLELESLFKGVEQVKLLDGFSDYGTSYSVCVKIKNPHYKQSDEYPFLSNQEEWDMLMNVVPRRNGYNIRDYRLLNSVNKDYNMNWLGFNNVNNLSLKDLVERLFSSELSLSMFGMMKVENQTDGRNVDFRVENILIKSIESFDFDREKLKEQLLNKLKREVELVMRKKRTLSDNKKLKKMVNKILEIKSSSVVKFRNVF